MARPVDRLSARAVQTAKTNGKARMLADGRGLYLRIEPGGTKNWIFRYQRDGQRHDIGLGPFPDISLAAARERAQKCRRMLLDGIDPLEARKAEHLSKRLDAAKSETFRACAERYIASHKAGWRNAKHASQWQRTLNAYVYPVFGALPVQAIDVALVMRAIEPIWTTKPETASRVRGRIESILDYAAARGYRQGENPARWRGHLDKLLPRKSKVRRTQHYVALPYIEIGAFMTELRRQNGVAARALEFAILTATRSSEVRGARWQEINFTDRIWTIPSNRMKSAREHRVPLSAAAIAIIEQMTEIRHSDFIFPGARNRQPLGAMALLRVLHSMALDNVTAHGFRSTFSDWCSERTNFPSEVREMALAHAVGDKVEAAYRRGDLFEKRRRLAEAWGRFATTEPNANVVHLSAAR